MAGPRVPRDPPQYRRTFTHPDLRRIGRFRDPSGNAIVLVDTDYLFVATTIGAAAGTLTARRRSHGSREDATRSRQQDRRYRHRTPVLDGPSGISGRSRFADPPAQSQQFT